MKVAVEVRKMDFTVVLIAGLAVTVIVGASALRFFTSLSGEVVESVLTRCRSKRARACPWSTARGSLLFQCRPGGKGMMVGLKWLKDRAMRASVGLYRRALRFHG